MSRDTWYRLDNVGTFYASQAGGSRQTVFRYAATLTDEVDPEVLQTALVKTVETFPNFNVCLRSGLFWHYLEPSGEAPRVTPETLPVCYGLHVNARSVLFRVSYYGRRVNLEVSHILSDGRGSLQFFRALLHFYLCGRYGISGAVLDYDGSDPQKAENSFDKHFERDKRGVVRTPRAWRLPGAHDEGDPTFMELHVSVAEVLGLARSWGVSLTSLVCAVLIASLSDEMTRRERHRTICMDVPVDLRSLFNSVTSMNFFSLAFVSYTPVDHGEADEPVQAIARSVQEQLKQGCAPEVLKRRMNAGVALEKNPLLRFVPLFVKDLVLEVADRLVARSTTATVSNIGPIKLDPALVPYVRDLNILTSTTGLKFTLCSFGDDLSIGMASAYANHNVLKSFCRFFTSQGMAARMNVSKSRQELADDLAQARFEDSVRRLGERPHEVAGTGAPAGRQVAAFGGSPAVDHARGVEAGVPVVAGRAGETVAGVLAAEAHADAVGAGAPAVPAGKEGRHEALR